MSENQPSYYAIIPSNVRYCKDLEPNAKLLYGEITALCNKEGYCWAGDQYFADLYGAGLSTIKTWIASLKKLGFIWTEPYNDGFKRKRRIYIVELKKSIQSLENETIEENKTIDGLENKTIGRVKNETSYNMCNNTSRIKQQHKKVATAPVVVFSSDEEKREEDADKAATQYINSEIKKGNRVNETRIRKQALKEGWKPNTELSSMEMVNLFKNGALYEGKNGEYECIIDEHGIGFLPIDFHAPQPYSVRYNSKTFRKDFEETLEKLEIKRT